MIDSTYSKSQVAQKDGIIKTEKDSDRRKEVNIIKSLLMHIWHTLTQIFQILH